MAETNELSGINKFIYERLVADAQLVALVNNGNEIQVISKGTHTAGTFTITYEGQTTVATAFNATAATLQTNLEALSNIAPGDVIVTGAAGGPWSVEFDQNLGDLNVSQLVMTSSLTGGSGHRVDTTREGGPRIYAMRAPQGRTYPYVLFSFVSGRDREAFGADSRIFTRPEYMIKGVTLGTSLVTAGQIANRIEAVMLGARADRPDLAIRISGVYRLSPVMYPEAFEGKDLNHVGGLYRFFVHKL